MHRKSRWLPLSKTSLSLGADTSARQLLPRSVLAMHGPYSVALYIAEHVVQSDAFNVELVQALHFKLLSLERLADEIVWSRNSSVESASIRLLQSIACDGTLNG